VPSIRKNFGYNLLLTVCGYIIPFITFPYISRVLGVQNLGVCNFVDSIINYFVLFSMLGVGSYGVREIARVRLDEGKRNAVFTNLVLLNLVMTVVAIIVLIVCTFSIPKLADYRPFLLIGIVKLVFNVFLIEWFYQGIQDFKYITIRSLAIRLAYVVAIFVFIRSEADVLLYYFITTLTTVLNACINFLHSKRYVKIDIRAFNPKIFIVPVLSFGYYRVLTSMYTTFNTVFLGFSCNDIEVGYFSTATKLYSIIMSVLSAFTTVMIPHVSELIRDGQVARLQKIADQTLMVISSISIPLIVFCQFCAPDIIRLIAGPGYEGAIVPFRIVIFLLLIIGAEQILIQQFLMASTKNKPIIAVSSLGAVTGVLLNVLLTPSMGSIGSSCAWGISEVCVLVLGIILVKKNLNIIVPFKGILANMLWSLLYIPPLLLISHLHLDLWQNLLLSSLVVFVVFILINFLLHRSSQLAVIIGDNKKQYSK